HGRGFSQSNATAGAGNRLEPKEIGPGRFVSPAAAKGGPGMATVLVVDDSSMDRHLAGSFLEKQTDPDSPPLTVSYAADGRESLAALGRQALDLVVTDLQMPEIDGRALVK